jgi:hypothetical protein
VSERGSVGMKFVSDKLPLNTQFVFEYFGSSLSAPTIIPSILRTLLHINITVVRRKNVAKPWKVQFNYVSDNGGGESGQSSASILFFRRLRA